MVSLTHQIQRVTEGSRNLGRILRSPLMLLEDLRAEVSGSMCRAVLDERGNGCGEREGLRR